jgi:hypothetical protein
MVILSYYLKLFFLSLVKDFCSLDWKLDGMGLKGLLLFSVSGLEFSDLLLDFIAGIAVSKKSVSGIGPDLSCTTRKDSWWR